MAQDNFPAQVHNFVQNIGNNWRPPAPQENTPLHSPDHIPNRSPETHPERGTPDRNEHEPAGPSNSRPNSTECSITIHNTSYQDCNPASPIGPPPVHTQPCGNTTPNNDHQQTQQTRGRGGTAPRGIQPNCLTTQDQHLLRPGPLLEISNYNQGHPTSATSCVRNETQQEIRRTISTHNNRRTQRKQGNQENSPQPRSRPKVKCGFGPGKHGSTVVTPNAHDATASGTAQYGTHPSTSPIRPHFVHNTATTLPEDTTFDIDELLREIENTRQDRAYEASLDRREARPQAMSTYPSNRPLPTPKSRPKAKCRFGPYSRHGRSHHQLTTAPHGNASSSAGNPDRLPVQDATSEGRGDEHPITPKP